MKTKKTTSPLGKWGIKRVCVVVGQGTDTIQMELDGPTTFPAVKYPLFLRTEAQRGCGVQWVKDNLGVDPEVAERSGGER